MASQQLAGSRLLIIEDEYYLADDARSVFSAAGAQVLGPLATVMEARALIDAGTDIDGVLLDVNLRGQMAFEVADDLELRGIPYAFVTGYDRVALPERFSAAARLEKPVNYRQLVELFGRLTAPKGPQGLS